MRFVDVEGARLSAIGLGCWQFGSSDWGYGEDYARREAGAIVNRALDLGVNLVDTAEIYGYGRSERIVGEAIRGRRDEVFLATKLFPVMPLAPVVQQRARASARRLGVDTIDLYQVHWPNPFVPNGPTMDGMRRVIDEGLVRYAGVSNFPLTRWQDAERRLGRPVISNQVLGTSDHLSVPRPRSCTHRPTRRSVSASTTLDPSSGAHQLRRDSASTQW